MSGSAVDVATTGIRVLLCVQMTTRSDANEHEADSATDRQCVCLSVCPSLCVSVCALVDVVHRDVFRASVIVLFTIVSSCVTDCNCNF